MRKHGGSCAYTQMTIDPDYRSCEGCGAIKRVVIIMPAKAQEHSEPSKEAARHIEPKRHALRVAVYQAFLAARDGMTDEEMQDALGMEGSTERPRRVELVESGAVIDSGRTRSTKSGRQATVWVAVSDLPRTQTEGRQEGEHFSDASLGRSVPA